MGCPAYPRQDRYGCAAEVRRRPPWYRVAYRARWYRTRHGRRFRWWSHGGRPYPWPVVPASVRWRLTDPASRHTDYRWQGRRSAGC